MSWRIWGEYFLYIWNSSVTGYPVFSFAKSGNPRPHTSLSKKLTVGLPWWLSGKEFPCQCRRHGFDPRSGASHMLRNGLAHEPQLLSLCSGAQDHNCWAQMLQLLKSKCPGARDLWEVTAAGSQPAVTRGWPALTTERSACSKRPSTAGVQKWIKLNYVLRKAHSETAPIACLSSSIPSNPSTPSFSFEESAAFPVSTACSCCPPGMPCLCQTPASLLTSATLSQGSSPCLTVSS